MKVLFLTSSFPRHSNDSQILFVYEQALAWKKARSQDEVFVMAPHDKEALKEEELNGLHIRRFVYFWPYGWQKLAYPALLPNIRKNPLLIFQVPFYLIGLFAAAYGLTKKNGIGLIMAHWVMPQGLIAYWIHCLTKTPYALKNYTSDVKLFGRIPLFGRALARAVIRRSQALYCENRQLKEDALALFGESERPVMEKKIFAIPMGVRDLNEGPDSTAGGARYDFAFMGRLTKKKGLDFFIKALLALSSSGTRFQAAIAGEGEEKEHLVKLATDPHIEFISFVTEGRKMAFIRRTRFLVFPSKAVKEDVEGMPVAMLEALYYGKTILVSKDTNIELLPEWPQLKEYVFFLEDPENITAFSEALKRMQALGTAELDRRAVALKQIMAKYNWNKIISEYINPLQLS